MTERDVVLIGAYWAFHAIAAWRVIRAPYDVKLPTDDAVEATLKRTRYLDPGSRKTTE